MKNYLFLLSICLLAFSCVDEFDDSTTVTTTNHIEVNVITDISGYVQNEAGEGIPSVEVQIKNYSTETNENGAFVFHDIEVNKNGTHVSVDNRDYFFGSRVIFPTSTKSIYTEITLMKKEGAELVQADEDNEIEIYQGAMLDKIGSIKFEANCFMDEEGEVYSGQVMISTRYIDPTLTNANDMMPGALIAKKDNGERGTLIGYSMIAVTLQDMEGNELLLNPEKPATVKFPIPDLLQFEAPDEITLWHFEEFSGYWMEEGKATKTNGFYEASLAHFSFWNCYDFVEDSYIKGRVINQDGIGLSNLLVNLTLANGSSSASDRTDLSGCFRGYVPKNEELLLTISSNCDLLYETSIGPFTEEVETLEDIVVDDMGIETNTMTITGDLLSCTAEPIPLGKIQLLENGVFSEFFNAQSDGSINITLEQGCYTGELAMFGYHRDEIMTTDTFYFGIQENLELGDWFCCNNAYPPEMSMYYGFSQKVKLETIIFDFDSFTFTAFDEDSDLNLEFGIDDFDGEGQYIQDDPGFFANVNFGDCSSDSLIIGSIEVTIKETESHVSGTLISTDWTAVNDTPEDCMSPAELVFLGVSIVLEK
ncbi:MAG: carboxypeptidase-like regulatory domain-containing protein [Bacteroidota bacterium]